MFRKFLAWRYTTSRFITFAAFLLVSMSVSILIILLAVMEGFKTEMIDRIRGTSADLKVDSVKFVGLEDHELVRERVEAVEGVVAALPYVEVLAVFNVDLDIGEMYLNVQGLDLEAEARVGRLDEYIQNFSRDNKSNGVPQNIAETYSREWIENGVWQSKVRAVPEDRSHYRPLLLGAEVLPVREEQRHLLLGLLAELKTISPITNELRTGEDLEFFVANIFKSKDVAQDNGTILMSIEDAKDFLDLYVGDNGESYSISGFRVFIDPEKEAKDIQSAIVSATTDVPFLRVRTWRDEKAKIVRAVQMEKILVGIILGVTVVFVGLMIFIILTVQMVERTRDIGILQAVGATPPGVARIYLWIGFGICLTGIALGSVVGLGFCYNIETIERWIFVLTGHAVFPKDVYYIDRIPARPVLSDFLFIIVPTVLVSLLGSTAAARRASRRSPVEAFNYE